jgi:histidinol dehydrogenase
MQSELLLAAGEDPAGLARALRKLVPAGQSVRERVAEIIDAVRTGGDEALSRYTQRFDTAGAPPPDLTVAPAELESAVAQLPREARAGLELAIANVRRVAEAGLGADCRVSFDDGHEVVLREAPVDRAGVYVPGGRAPYPSTVVMGVVTARAAGVADVVVCSPPGRDGDVEPVILAACHLAGAHTVYRMGGAQAVAALAYGTQSVGQVDVIVGPGNLYVQEAKQQVFGQVGIDGFAGPSDLLVVADAGADARLMASDLLAQAEHGEATIVIGVSPDLPLLRAVASALRRAPETGALARFVHVDGVEDALALAQAFAPEHLQLMGAGAEALAPRATHAGCVLVGGQAGTAFGDYIAGSNHVLPTGGAARFASALSPLHFRRRFTEVRIGAAAPGLARAGAAIARAEGFELHARSMEQRIRDNGGR